MRATVIRMFPLTPDPYDGEGDDDPLAGIREQAEAFHASADRELRRSGIHIESMSVLIAPPDPTTGRPSGPNGVQLHCLITDKAWSAEVLRPEHAEAERQLEEALNDAEVQAIREILQADLDKKRKDRGDGDE